jgi:hypothetical protein
MSLMKIVVLVYEDGCVSVFADGEAEVRVVEMEPPLDWAPGIERIPIEFDDGDNSYNTLIHEHVLGNDPEFVDRIWSKGLTP